MGAAGPLTPALLSLPFGIMHSDGQVYLTQTGQRFLQEVISELNNPVPALATSDPGIPALRETDPSAVAWTPTLVGQTTAGAPTYGSALGYLARIGPCVHAAFAITLTGVGGIAGNVVVNGLPFAANASGPTQAGALSEWSNVTLAANNTTLGIQIAPGSPSINLVESGSGIAATLLQGTGLAATSLMVGSLTYFI